MTSKNGQLICQHLEGASAKLFEQYADILKEYVRGRHGVYALYKGDRLYYVGLAKNLRARINRHLSDKHKRRWDHFSIYIIINHKHVKELETLVIRMIKPKGNKQRGKFIRSENLKLQLARDLRKQQRDELAKLLGKKYRGSAGKSKNVVKSNYRADSGALISFINKGFAIRGYYKGKLYKARVYKNGWIRFGKFLYKTPSGAGKAARKRSTNGWSFWHYQRSPGDWVSLKVLRK